MKKLNITETVMANPKIAFLLVGILVVFGIFGLDNMNKQEFPEFPIREGLIAAVYPGANAEEVEQQLTKPLEEYLFSFQEVDKKGTRSVTKEGMTYIYVELDESIKDQNVVWSKIRHGLKDFKMMLPSGVLAVVVIDDFGNTASVLITMDSKEKTYRELERYMDVLKERLRNVPAVGNIKSYGEVHEEIDITIDREKLASYGVSQQTLMASLFTQGLISVGGSIESNENNLALHVASPISSENEIGEQIVLGAITPIRLKDIATIERRYESPSSYITKDGHKALVLSIEMRSGNNIVKFGDAVNEVMDEFQRTLPDDVTIYRITDLPKVVDESIWGFMKDLLTAILVVIAVMLLLFPLTTALIPAIEIPLTVAISLSVMYIIGYELNIVTLAGLIVTLGMIVDDSIVMIDGYVDNLRHGMTPWNAAVQSTKTFFPSLIVATASICAIFFPYLFTMHGYLAEFVKFFPTTITISLSISLALAMLLTPWLEQKIIKSPNDNELIREELPGKKKNFRQKFADVQNRFFDILEGGYQKLLTKCFAHPWATLGCGLLSVLLAGVLFLQMPLQLMPGADRDSFAVEIYLPEGSSLSQTDKVCHEVEGLLKQNEDIVAVTTFVGTSSPRFMCAYTPQLPGSNYSQMIVNTHDAKATEKVIRCYKDLYIDSFPEAVVRFKQMAYQVGDNPIEICLRGEDPVLLRQYADSVKAILHQFDDDLKWIHSNCDGYVPSLRVDLIPEEASRLGITKAVLSANLATLYGGLPLTTIWEDDYSLAVKLKVQDNNAQRMTASELESVLIPTSLPGVWVPLRQVAHVVPEWKPATICHTNGVPSITIGADLQLDRSQPVVMKKIRPILEGEFKESLPEGITMGYGGLDSMNADYIGDIAIGMITSVLIVFFFLLFNFKKFRLTLLSLCGTMLCLFGAFLGLLIFRCDVSMTALIGIVSLLGINVRNTIVMFDYAEELRRQGIPLKEVAFQAGCRRMRPIFLTSATTAVGVIPMIIHRNALWMPMGVVICFGTLFAIGLIVTVMPVAYWKLFDRKDKCEIAPVVPTNNPIDTTTDEI